MKKVSRYVVATLGMSALSLSPMTVFASTPHTVRSGDTLWGIARTFHTTVQKLEQVNHLHSSLIRVGQRLQVSSGGSEKAPVKATVKATARAASTPAVQPAIKNIPSQLVPVYKAAGSKYHVTWTVLAAIHKMESNFSTSGHLRNAEGAEGPMQFMPSTFKAYGVAAPGHRVPNIYNVDDAIYSTAHMLAADGFATSPQKALYNYNHSISYQKQVMRLASI